MHLIKIQVLCHLKSTERLKQTDISHFSHLAVIIVCYLVLVLLFKLLSYLVLTSSFNILRSLLWFWIKRRSCWRLNIFKHIINDKQMIDC